MAKGKRTVLVDGQELVVRVVRSRRRRRSLGIELTREPVVVVRAPWQAGEEAIARALAASSSWLARRLARLRELGVAGRSGPAQGDELLFLGVPRSLRLARTAANRARLTLEGDRLLAELPVAEAGRAGTALLGQLLEAWYRRQAAAVFAERLDRYAARLGMAPPPLRISHARKRWGSCNPATGRINLAWRLVMAPLELVDYVVVHELCHLRQPDHSSRFWRLVAGLLPDYQARRRQLRREGMRFDL